MEPETKGYQQLQVDERAYRFFPLHQQEKHNFNSPKGSRVYFHGQIQHDDYEKQKLAEFLEFLKVKVQNKYDQKYFTPHMLVLFLSSYEYNCEKTYKAMNEHMEFVSKYIRDQQGNRIIRYETDPKVKSLIDAGFFYVCGRDHHFRPTIVFNLRKTDLKDPEAVLRGIVFVQEEVIEKMFIPGQVECWNIIYDLGGMGLTDLPVNALKSALQAISANYGGRLYKLWMLNSPSSIYFSWKVVKNFLDPVTVDKIHIIKKNTDEHLWKLYNKNQIEQKYGGTQPNRTTFYPFKVPKAIIDESRLVSHEKYAKLEQSGLLKRNTIDPKYLSQKNQVKIQQIEEKVADKTVNQKQEEVKAEQVTQIKPESKQTDTKKEVENNNEETKVESQTE